MMNNCIEIDFNRYFLSKFYFLIRRKLSGSRSKSVDYCKKIFLLHVYLCSCIITIFLVAGFFFASIQHILAYMKHRYCYSTSYSYNYCSTCENTKHLIFNRNKNFSKLEFVHLFLPNFVAGLRFKKILCSMLFGHFITRQCTPCFPGTMQWRNQRMSQRWNNDLGSCKNFQLYM